MYSLQARAPTGAATKIHMYTFLFIVNTNISRYESWLKPVYYSGENNNSYTTATPNGGIASYDDNSIISPASS